MRGWGPRAGKKGQDLSPQREPGGGRWDVRLAQRPDRVGAETRVMLLRGRRACLRSGRVGRDHRSCRYADALPLRKARGLAESFLPQPAERRSETQFTQCGEGCRADQKRGTRGTRMGPRRDASRCRTSLFDPSHPPTVPRGHLRLGS